MASRLFEFIDCLTYKKQRIDFDDDETEKEYSQVSIDNALSMCDLLVPIVSQVSMLNLPKHAHEAMYQAMLPQRRFHFEWTKKAKRITSEEYNIITDYYHCTIQQADEYVKILSDDEIDSILKMYTYGVNKKITA